MKKDFTLIFNKKEIYNTLFFFDSNILNKKFNFLRKKINFLYYGNFGSIFNLKEKKNIIISTLKLLKDNKKFQYIDFFKIQILKELPKYFVLKKINAKCLIGNDHFLNSNAFQFDMVKSRKVKTVTINCSHSGILPLRK